MEKNQFNPVEQDEANDRDLTGMERWIESLTYESLVNALEFTFQADGDNSGDHRGSPGKSGSKEFDLLMEMSSLQCPDHIRQMFDGLREVEHYGWRRSMKARMETPCLFRWVNQEFEGNNGSCETSKDVNSIKEEPKPEPPSDDPLAFLAMGASSMPSDLLDILAQAGVKRSTSSLLQTFNEADEIDKAFESLKDCQDNMAKNANATSPPLPTNFRVNTHQGVSDEGSSLGRGSTVEQQNADRSILLWTAFVRDRTINTSEEEKNNDRSTLWLPRCTLTVADDSTITDQQRKTLILDTMHVASRGKFLSGAGKQRRAYMAPWFDPTQQWFSLPMYLASRFEASLWNAYLQRSHISDDSKKNSLVHTVKNLDEDAIGRVLCYAVGAVMRDDINVKDKILKSQTATSDSIRDTLLWKLLLWSENGSIFPNPGFDVTPLLEWDTPQGRLKSLVMDHLQEGLAREAERSLMRSMHAERSDKPRLKKQKKKRPKKKKGCNSSQPTTKLTEDAQSGDDQNSDDDDDEPHVECILPTTPSDTLTDFCEPNSSYHSPQNENNSAKIVVLQVLDELLNNVFARLGLQQDEEFGDFKDAVTVKSRGEYSQRGLKTLSADDIEVATTALMSNKEGASVDAAMNLLQRTGHHRNHSQSPVQSQKLWASRSRRQTLERTGGQNDGSHLKRSKSSGDSSMSKRKPPVNPGKIYQPTLPQSRHDDILWPSSDSPLFPQASQNETSIFDGAPLCLSGALDGWNSVACRKQNETSIFTDLLRNGQGDANPDHDQLKVASSTAASIASSRGDGEDADLDIGSDWLESPPRYESLSDANKAVHFKDIKIQSGGGNPSPIEPSGQSNCVSTRAGALKVDTFPKERVDSPIPCIISESPLDIELSPSPSAPPTPPPQLSPIIVSLADLRKLRETVPDVVSSNPQLFSGIPKPPTLATVTRTLTPSLSRDDLRSIDQCRKTARRVRDDHHTIGHRQVDALLSYRNVVAHSAPRKPPSLKSYDGKQKHRDDAHPIFGRSTRSIKTTRSGMWPPGPEFPSLSSSVSSMPLYKEPILNKVLHLDVACAKSESGLDGVDDASHCNVIPRVQTDDTMTKDGATTISSVHSHPETENLATLKEERNNYRDMCLTLGAENAKLRNLLASKTCAPLYNHPASFAQDTMAPHFYRNDQQYMPTQNSFPNQFSTHSIVAMSDAGVHRVDYDSSAMSEDGTDVHPSVVAIGLESQNSISWQARGDSVQSFGRRTSGGGTYAESETSLEHNIGGQESHAFSGLHRVHQQDSFFGAGPLHGIESRLSKDITRYMRSLRSQLKKTEGRRSLAVEGITKTVKVRTRIFFFPIFLFHEVSLLTSPKTGPRHSGQERKSRCMAHM